MNKIHMVDLTTQHQKLQPQLNQAIHEVISSSAFINGQAVKDFAHSLAQFLQAGHVIPCANGTDALQIALMALDLPSGCEIIVPTFNYVAAVEVIALLGFKPVFVDAHPTYFNMDVSQIEKLITPQTKAIIPVHLFGQSVDMDGVMEIAQKHHLYVIEDNAQAIGATYTSESGTSKKTGTIGHIGTTSFFPSKNLGCMGDGGAVFTNDDELAIKLRQIANHGQRTKYHFDRVGLNSRLDTLQAAVLNIKLQHLPAYIEARQKAAEAYSSRLSSVEALQPPQRNESSTHVFHQYTLQLANASVRDAMKEALKAEGIPSMIYYPKPLHLHRAYQYLGYQTGDFPVAEALSQKVLSLPMHTELTSDQLDYICEKVRELLTINAHG